MGEGDGEGGEGESGLELSEGGHIIHYTREAQNLLGF